MNIGMAMLIAYGRNHDHGHGDHDADDVDDPLGCVQCCAYK